MWEAWTTGTLGVWLVIEAFLRFSPRGNLWNDLLVGLIIAVVGMLMTDRKPWQGWISSTIGFWLILAAFIPSMQALHGNMWNALLSGVVLAICGFTALIGGKHSENMHSHA